MTSKNNSKRQQAALEEARRRQYVADCHVLRDGVTPEAVEVLKRRFLMHLPVFQLRAEGKTLQGDTQLLILEAALRDGAHEVILTIERMRNFQE